MPDSKKIFFVIVTYNSASTIRCAIESIFTSQNIDPQIIIVDNASKDHTIQKCKKLYPHITYLENTSNKGFASAVNQGIDHAIKKNAEYVVLFNPDAILEKNCVIRTISEMKEKNIAIASPRIFTVNSPRIWFEGGKITWLRMRAIHKKPQTTNPLPPNSFISGCVMVISRCTIDTIGLFDEKFFLYYEDTDYSLRAQNAGLAISIIENARADHYEISENNMSLKTYHLVLSGLLFFHKHTYHLTRLYFWSHFYLRVTKNLFDLLRKKECAKNVHEAFIDFKKML
jgi:GT2 family glycosyltransferase